jgi:two-component system cell cycle sensor histidine kinase/response regulator CckA
MNLQVHVGDRGRLAFDRLGLGGPSVSGSEHEGPGRDESSSVADQRILLVEDDRGIREVLRGILEEHGYAVSTAENGREALEALQRGRAPDLIILDLRMPVMDGWQFRAAQKADPVLAEIPVLALSADGSAKAEAIDAAAYIRKPLRIDVVLRTITRILVEAERKRLLCRLEEAERLAALGRLAASVGHEINNPLAYVSMNLDIMAIQINRYIEDSAQAFEVLSAVPVMLKECRIGLDRMRDVVKGLHALSRKPQGVLESFSMNELIDESLAMACSYVRHRATVRKDYGDVPAVLGDRSAIGQVLLNLILNAAQALPEGQPDANAITLRTYAEGGHITVEVRDTGTGISGEALPHIFDPFFTTKPIGEGTGLGLAVSFRIVADHAGRIDVDTQVGQGSSFRVVLPVAGPPLDRPAIGPERDSASVRARILVIDDVAAIGESIMAALPEHDVSVVSRATEAFTVLASNDTFDVILCDLQTPDLGGRDLLERLETDWPHLASKVIFMTGGAFTPDSRAFLEGCHQRVLTKPFPIDQLRTTIVMHLQERLGERH